MKTKDITNTNINKLFFHYTNIKNIKSISKNGLIPKIGKNSKEIEKSEKIFFCIGDLGVLTLMEVWIRWLVLRPNSNFIYKCGANYMRKKYLPQFIVTILFRIWANNKLRIKNKCKKLKKIMNNSVFLALDLKENKDFGYEDIDEVKSQNFIKKHLKYIYEPYGNLDNNKMDYWNMHTYSNKNISKDKITLLKIKGSTNANDILRYLINKNENYVNNNLPYLRDYYIKLLNK